MNADENLRAFQREIENRVYHLESLAVRTLMLLWSGLLVLGSVLPTYDKLEGDVVPTLRIATAGFQLVTSDGSGEAQTFNVIAGIGFLGFLACLLVALGVGVVQWERQAGKGTVRTAKVVSWLLLIAMLVPLGTLPGVAGDKQLGEAGPAMWLFVPGVLLFTTMAYSGFLRKLWAREY